MESQTKNSYSQLEIRFSCVFISLVAAVDLQLPVWLLHIVLILSDLFQDPSRRTSGYNLGSLPTRTDPGHCRS